MGPHYIEETQNYLHTEAILEARVQEEEIIQEKELQKARNAVYKNIAFADINKGSYLNIRKNASVESEWVGRLQENDVAKVIAKKGEWLKIKSGKVKGFVRAEDMITGKKAVKKAKKLAAEKYEAKKASELTPEQIEKSFSFAKSKKRIEKEYEKMGEQIVDFAAQFLGNPYVWGGTSLTNGTDCSGFVMGVYAHFGVGLPHSSTAMRNVGTEVSYEDVRLGDIVCYNGHVGIYAGKGRIVNASNKAGGIKYSSATYSDIITVRRIF